MLSNTDMNQLKRLSFAVTLSCLCSSLVFAESIDCSNSGTELKICSKTFSESKKQLDNKYLSAYLVTDAPLQLLQDTQKLWSKHTQQCKNNTCVQQQFDLRTDDLNFYASLKQTLTQHYLKFENGRIAAQPVHIQVHQLAKDKIKIEGIAYRNPNNRKETQTISLMAYSSPEQKSEILDNEHNCKYQFNFQKALLNVKTQQKGCERFSGIYRLYD
ncbi:hypothetical protein RMB03_05935 [Acinetobacter sp. V91_7]|uniref:A1S_1983 family putative colistin resistance protein n=1 Tax=unclassified Acinetobacter TaxID=196816 RepID=UPI00287E8FD7|nr:MULTISPECIES: hypothetical protein [unclassified Acinetobacter]MDS7935336.1 hypothetical protein [Acinetobacter sp. V91_4B]MDS7962492.1 hypothetical protein [Acinetobacter sp. V91_7]MDS8026397.1 hypothetical protein [Acinetobacter sp. V91_13]